MRNTNKRQGFTIVELVIVIAVIAILAGVLIPTFSNVIQKAKDSRDQQDALNIYKEQVLALKADNELEDTNNNGKEEVLVVLRENQTDVKYFLFVDGKCMESTADAPCDIIVTEEGVSQGNNQGGNQEPDSPAVEKTYTLTKVTSVEELIGKTVYIISDIEGEKYIAKPYASEGKLDCEIVDNMQNCTETFLTQYAAWVFEKNDETSTWKIHQGNKKLRCGSENGQIKTKVSDGDFEDWVISIDSSSGLANIQLAVSEPTYTLLFRKNDDNGDRCIKHYSSSNVTNPEYVLPSLYIAVENN